MPGREESCDMKIIKMLALFFVLANASVAHGQTIAILGGVIVDLSNYGRSSSDVIDAVVVIRNGKITAVGPASQVRIPSDATRINAHGMFLVPGLIDGFGALRTEGFANAYLYEGVTTVYVPTVLPDGGGDGEIKVFANASRGPRLFLGAPMTGYSETGIDPSDKPMTYHRLYDRRLSDEQLVARIDSLADKGFRGVTISYDVWPDQVDVIVRESKKRGLATLAEPAFTDYPYAIRAGVNALVHNDHYLLELAPSTAKLARADDVAGGISANQAVCASDPMSIEMTAYAQQLAQSGTALMPTLAIEATADGLDVGNPWSVPSAALILPTDLDYPVDPLIGGAPFLASLPSERRTPVRECAWHREALDARFTQLGVKFLAGSAASEYGIIPGNGLHVEIVLLQRIGLSPRAAIAAATSNFADIYGWHDVGRLEPERAADILILNADPRMDVAALDHIHTLVFNGKVIDRTKLLQLRAR
jgi:hypothetical protein